MSALYGLDDVRVVVYSRQFPVGSLQSTVLSRQLVCGL